MKLEMIYKLEYIRSIVLNDFVGDPSLVIHIYLSNFIGLALVQNYRKPHGQ